MKRDRLRAAGRANSLLPLKDFIRVPSVAKFLLTGAQVLGPDELGAGEASDEAAHLEDAEGGHRLGGGQAGQADEVVDGDGLVGEVTEERALVVGEGQLGRVADGGGVV